ncbi:helix-turn-helix domain-containing protein [Rhizobium tubonense]|uniref:HTH araC/xylS-type domain-containing protein n=1 Tax=Rhizobium tubonense TaxID=484088 RepID=A0A2W4CX74_9HYPH|nr:helix-turn-helix domain-containing protein [Rhizobium tubonense]PZM14825.1 hypothetical protein CPY51_08930 [Rhizobium tubonense]
MAEIGGLKDRTFLRRFQKATGLKPTEYSQRLRAGRAREMLEFTGRTVDLIARDWLRDPASFRRVYKPLMGMSPSDYRRRFTVDPAPKQ